MVWHWRRAAVLVLVGTVVGCSSDGTVATPETEAASATTSSGAVTSTVAAIDLPTVWAPPLSSLVPGIQSTLLGAIIAGELTYNDVLDCFMLQGEFGDSWPVVWPAGTVASSDGLGVVTASGQTFEVGDTVDGGGGYQQVGDLWNIPAGCGTEIAVLNPSGVVSG